MLQTARSTRWRLRLGPAVLLLFGFTWFRAGMMNGWRGADSGGCGAVYALAWLPMIVVLFVASRAVAEWKDQHPDEVFPRTPPDFPGVVGIVEVRKGLLLGLVSVVAMEILMRIVYALACK